MYLRWRIYYSKTIYLSSKAKVLALSPVEACGGRGGATASRKHHHAPMDCVQECLQQFNVQPAQAASVGESVAETAEGKVVMTLII